MGMKMTTAETKIEKFIIIHFFCCSTINIWNLWHWNKLFVSVWLSNTYPAFKYLQKKERKINYQEKIITETEIVAILLSFSGLDTPEVVILNFVAV